MIFDRLSPKAAYRAQLALFMALYLFFLVMAERVDFARDLSSPVFRYLVAVSPALPIGGVILALLRFIERSDEYVRALTAKRFIAASGMVFALATGWGFLELYGGVPAFPLYLLFAVFCGAFALTTPFIKTTR